MSYTLKLPPVTYAGKGSLSMLGKLVADEKAKEVLLCTDQGVRRTGLLEQVEQTLRQNPDLRIQILDTLVPEPSYQAVEENLRAICRTPDLIIALGGGSVMDAAKLFSVLYGAEYTIRDLLENPDLAKKRIKTVMLPTTCGTGAEATCNAIVAIPEKSVKMGIVSDQMIPDVVILEPEMVRRLPKSVVAATGVDALAHVVECYTSNKATAFSDLYAAAGAKLIFRNLITAYEEPDNMEAKEAMMLGAYYGGISITASGTTAVHALSYPLGGKYHIAHGVSNAILFAPVMRVNREACQERLAALCDEVFPERQSRIQAEKAEAMIEEISRIVEKTHIPTDLAAFGVPSEDLDFLVEAGSQQKRLLNNNRKVLSLEDIRGIYQAVFRGEGDQ